MIISYPWPKPVVTVYSVVLFQCHRKAFKGFRKNKDIIYGCMNAMQQKQLVHKLGAGAK